TKMFPRCAPSKCRTYKLTYWWECRFKCWLFLIVTANYSSITADITNIYFANLGNFMNISS
ncbi:MAG: hypothetical protein ACKPKO_59410, partial [Candidatus Fonsibacter sp.]